MAPLVLEGDLLGHKHRDFNRHVKVALDDDTYTLTKIDHNDSDIDNLFRIDVACARKDVQYLLDVLKCDDMLYVSRAINKSIWFVTEQQYSHIINPKYLHEVLFLDMSSKAKTKLLLTIRLNLKDISRVEDFYHYFKKDFLTACKWLPGCSVALIKKTVQEKGRKISDDILKRLCEKSFEVFKIYCLNKDNYVSSTFLKDTSFLVKDNPKEYLDVYYELPHYLKPSLGKKVTQILMTNCREKIMNNFEKYCYNIDVPTLAKNLKSEEIENFLLEQRKNEMLNDWFRYDNIRHFLKHIPKETRFSFAKSLTFEKDKNVVSSEEYSGKGYAALKCQSSVLAADCGFTRGRSSSSNAHIYKWYRFAPFNTAFDDLKKLILIESSPSERNAITTILIHCAGSNQKHLQTLLEFYREKHVNEPFKFKIQFVNTFLTKTKWHLFNENIWKVLNDIFSSMEVYNESENSVQFCVEAIIVYKLLHNQNIPEVIEEKFKYNTLKELRKKLNKDEQDKVFNYLCDKVMKDLSKEVNNKSEMLSIVDTIQNMVTLLSDWNRNIVDHPVITNKIKELLQIRTQNSWQINLQTIYNINKECKRHLFEQSIAMNPCGATIMNALKHDSSMLSRYNTEVESLWCKDSKSLRQVLKKLRVYWQQSIRKEWADGHLKRLEEHKGQKFVVAGIFTLVPRGEILPLILKYVPVESKINWDSTDTVLTLRKNIASQMHLVRPSINLETVLIYAKEDYLWHTLPSLNAVLYNISPSKTSMYIGRLLNAPVSLQKHGIRVVFQKLKLEEIKDIMHNIWKNTKNSSIKTVLFKETYLILCKEKKDSVVDTTWELLQMFIDSLLPEENRIIYNIMSRVEKVPERVRHLFFMKSYLYIKSLPAKANCEPILANLTNYSKNIIDLLEPSFVENELLAAAEEKIVTKNVNSVVNVTVNILSSYLLSCNSEEPQMLRYKKLVVPILDKSFSIWNLRHKGNLYVKNSVKNFYEDLMHNLKVHVVNNKSIIPVKLFKTLHQKFGECLKAEENYYLFLQSHIVSLFVELLNEHIKNNPMAMVMELEEESKRCLSNSNKHTDDVWQKICLKLSSPLGLGCLKLLKEESLITHYPSLYAIVSNVLTNVCNILSFSDMAKCKLLKSMLSDENASIVYCVVIEMLRGMTYTTGVKAEKKEIRDILRANDSTNVKVHFYDYENSNCSDLESDDLPYNAC